MMPQNERELIELRAEVKELKEGMLELRTDIKGLVEAWATARGMTSFVKWLASLTTAAVVLYNVWHPGSSK